MAVDLNANTQMRQMTPYFDEHCDNIARIIAAAVATPARPIADARQAVNLYLMVVGAGIKVVDEVVEPPKGK
jgi:hypothetical protein